MPTLYLIDGHAQMFRAYYAIRGGMTSPITGEPTNALFAFTGMLIKMFQSYKPEYAAMVVDSPGKTFRDEIFAEYKANRDAPPDDFVAQIPRMFEIAKLFGLPIIEKPGFEADDIMATLATRLAAGEFDSDAPDLFLRLVAKDKDLEQVVGDRVVLFDVQTDATMDRDGVVAKRGITPEQVIDYQTLIGDSTDNIPGVKGIGPKTAAKLINQFGSVADLLANTDQLKGKQKENIEAAAETGLIDLSRKLVTLDPKTPVDFDLAETQTDGTAKIQGEQLLTLFRELGFTRHVDDLRKLLGLADTPTPAKAKAADNDAPVGLFAMAAEDADDDGDAAAPETNGNYRCIRTEAELQEVIETAKAQPLVAIDTETVGLGHRADLCGICLSWQEGEGVYIPTRSPEQAEHLTTDQVTQALRSYLEDETLAKCGHNIKYDMLVLKHAGVELRGVVFDSMIGAFLAGAPGIGMDDLALAELGHHCIPITQLIGPRPRKKSDPAQKTMDQIPLSHITPYAAEDADITLKLCTLFKSRLDSMGMSHLAADVEMPLVEVLATMEANGIRVEPSVLDAQKATLEVRIAELRAEVLERAKADFNPDSPKQLGDVLFNQLGFKAIKKTKTGFSTNSEVLEKLAGMTADELADVPEEAHAIPALMIEYRMLTKLTGTYFGNLVEAIWTREDGGDGRIHASFHQTGAATGRLSSSNPNLQNIPIRTDVGRQIRKAFVAEPGHVLIAADYSQIELRVLAHVSQDANLIQAFTDGEDIHRAVASQVFGTPADEVTSAQRGQAKTINFGIIYGVTAYGLARRIDELDNAAAQALIDSYKARFPGIDAFMTTCVDQAKEHGYVTTMLGRRRDIEQVHARNPMQRQLGERLAINTVVQGSAADLIKQAMVNLHRRIETEKLPMKMLLQIHDELVFETPAEHTEAMQAIITHEMEHAFELSVPLQVEAGIGEDWFAAK